MLEKDAGNGPEPRGPGFCSVRLAPHPVPFPIPFPILPCPKGGDMGHRGARPPSVEPGQASHLLSGFQAPEA